MDPENGSFNITQHLVLDILIRNVPEWTIEGHVAEKATLLQFGASLSQTHINGAACLGSQEYLIGASAWIGSDFIGVVSCLPLGEYEIKRADSLLP